MTEFTETIQPYVARKKKKKKRKKKKNQKMNVSILADAVESIIGAIYIDGGFSNSIRFIKKIWGPYLDIEESNFQDPKTHLQEISQQQYKKLPVYVGGQALSDSKSKFQATIISHENTLEQIPKILTQRKK